MSDLDLIFPNKLYYKEAFFLRFTAFDYSTKLDTFKEIFSENYVNSFTEDLIKSSKEEGLLKGVKKKSEEIEQKLSAPETNISPMFRCYLPISSAIKEDLKLQWKKAENIISGGNFTSEYVKTQIETLQSVVSGLVGAWGSGIGTPIKKALSDENLSVSSKRYIYPNYGYMFEGVGHRNFNFNYKLIPANQEEADTIIKIINGFKYFSLPGQERLAGINTVLKYPAMWTIEVMGLEKRKDGGFTITGYDSKTENIYTKIQKLIQFQELVLNSINITYGKEGEGEFYYYKDGMPSEININMTFTEMKFLTRETCGIDGKSLLNHPDRDSSRPAGSVGINIRNK